jgi:pimeloyl-[acyl-carrier protein] methyl ester esterase
MNWLLLRGLSRNHKHWLDFKDRAQAALPASKIHFIDLPGFGQNANQAAPLSISQNTQIVREQWQQLKSRGSKQEFLQPWGVLALSFGGVVALDWISKNEDFQSALIVNTSLSNFSSASERFNFAALSPILIRLGIAEEREKLILQLISNNSQRRMELESNWLKASEVYPISLRNTLRQLWAARQFTLDLSLASKIKSTHVTVIASEFDRLVSSSCSKKISKKLDLKLKIDFESGHDIPIDNPEFLIAEMKEAENRAKV